jgi:glycosyltransferase involved in cell wall biosynthesis
VSGTAPQLSLVIPSYNRADLIGATLDSALNQRVPFAEIIVVDDGSTDHTAEVLSRYSDRVRIIHLPNGGVQHARNTGVAAVRGEYAVLCDSDDLLEPDFVAIMAPWLDAHPGFDVVYSNFVTFNEGTVHPDKFALAPRGFFDGAQTSGAFLHDIPDLYVRTVGYQPLFVSGCVIRKSAYEAMGGYDKRFNGVGGEDWEFTLRLIGERRVAVCTVPLVRVRKHDGNESASNIHTVSGCIRVLEHALAQHPYAQPYREAILDSIDARRLDVFHSAFASGAFDTANHMLQQLRRRPHDRKFRLKAFIAALPGLLRQPLWQLTQRV